MSDPSGGPVTLSNRVEFLDVLRGFAVGGILLSNIGWFSGYGILPPTLAATAPVADRITVLLVHFLVEGKFYSIFSFLFGVGFAVQIVRAAERGDIHAVVFKRRLGWLLVIGLLHACFLWGGDILAIYAVVGFLLLPFRKKSNTSLLKWAVVLMVVPIVFYVLLTFLFAVFAPPKLTANLNATQLERYRETVRTVQGSSYLEMLTGYNLNYAIGRYVGAIMTMRIPKILAMFLLGLYAFRRGLVTDLASQLPFVRRLLKYALLLGVIGNLALVPFAYPESPFPPRVSGIVSVIAYAFGVPALALFYVSAIALLWQHRMWQRAFATLAAAGRMALTNYLLQSAVCVLLFYGYGFGLFGTVGAATATLIGLAVFLFQVLISHLWLEYFQYGPAEWVWRRLTYRQPLPLRVQRDVGRAVM